MSTQGKKRLVSLISTEGKSPEQISAEAKEAFEKFNITLKKVKKAVKEEQKRQQREKSNV